MNSFIIVSTNTSVQQEYVNNVCKEKGIRIFDQTVVTTDAPSLGIEDVRNLQKTVYLRPRQGSEKACIIQDAQKLTPEAQNALLKLLEEPPASTYIFLLATNDQPFLPTVISRCSIVRLTEEAHATQEENSDQRMSVLDRLQHGSIGEKLGLAQELSVKKDELAMWFEATIHFLRESLLKNPSQSREAANLIERLQDAYTTYKTTNVNPRLLLEHTFLTISENSDNSGPQTIRNSK